MGLKEDLRQRLLNRQQMQQYNDSKQALLSSGAGKAQTLGDSITKQGFLSGNNAGSVADSAGALSNANNAVSSAGSGIIDKVGGAISKGGGGALSSGLSLAGDVGNLTSGNGSARDGINAGIDAASMGLNFVPVWGQAAAAALQMGKGIYNMFAGNQEKKDAEATQMAESALSEQDKKKQEIMSTIKPAEVQNQLNPTTQLTPSNQQPIYTRDTVADSMKTSLTPGMEAGFQIAKSVSPFAKDSGYDYDFRKYYADGGKFNPSTSNGHLKDDYKTAFHPTYGTDWTQKGKMLEIPDTLQQGLELAGNGYDYSKYMDNGYDYSKYMDNGPSLQELLEEKNRRGI